jgi:hypothetical protein
MNAEGVFEWKPILDVHRNEVPWENIWQLITVGGQTLVVTGSHRIYVGNQETEDAEVTAQNRGRRLKRHPADTRMIGALKLPSRQYMYDLTVADNHNLVLHQSGVVVHNCPDKHYHFRPPEHEGSIGRYNRVFGQIWEDAELLEYVERALDWFNMFPPLTNTIDTVDKLVNTMPTWRTAILWGAIAHACFALAINWVADEFDYSIGGVSLTIEKSSKYESLKQNAESMFDKGTEAKARTVHFIRGLQQPRFGMGVRSAFGPFTGRGVLSPRNFV